MKRRIITIDDEKCDGCGACIPDCPEGALQMIDGKARLVSDLFCDGLGACLGACPEGAISVEEREAEPYDESRVMENIARQGPNVIMAHLRHLEDHRQDDYFREALAWLIENDIDIPAGFLDTKCRCGDASPAEPSRASACPGAKVVDRTSRSVGADLSKGPGGGGAPSRLTHWPVQIMLVPVEAPFLEGADLLLAADCVPFAMADFHEELLEGRVLLVGCPKLDDAGHYVEKIAAIFEKNRINSVMIAYMEVPCCGGLETIVEKAMELSGRNIPVARQKISIGGEKI